MEELTAISLMLVFVVVVVVVTSYLSA